MGGFYERLIGTVKRSIQKTVGCKPLTLAEFQTLVIEAEAIVNTRPLTTIAGIEVNDLCLTPAHLLFINPKVGLPNIEIDADPEYRPKPDNSDKIVKFWHNGQKALNYFWKVWKNDYLLSLREQKWDTVTRGASPDKPKVCR